MCAHFGVNVRLAHTKKKVIHSNEQDVKRDPDSEGEREKVAPIWYSVKSYYYRQRRMRKLRTEQTRKIVCFRVDYGVIEWSKRLIDFYCCRHRRGCHRCRRRRCFFLLWIVEIKCILSTQTSRVNDFNDTEIIFGQCVRTHRRAKSNRRK